MLKNHPSTSSRKAVDFTLSALFGACCLFAMWHNQYGKLDIDDAKHPAGSPINKPV
jgi:hypothetical protein